MKELKYYSEASMVAHEMAQDLYQIGAINDARMREYDEMCLVREPEAAKETAKAMEMDHSSPITAEI
jgi:DNA-binding transcriptional regulator YiaG